MSKHIATENSAAAAAPRRRPGGAGSFARAALLVAGAVCVSAAAQPPVEENTVNGIIPYPTHVSTLDNGLKVIVMPMPSNGIATYWSIVRTGSRDEYEEGRTGFAHFFEHMMFRGTEKYPADVYQQILTEMGADANAYTTDDLTAYHVTVAADDLERVIELEADRFRNLSYSRQDFETEAGAVYGEYRKSKTDPFFVLYERMRQTAFGKHPYGHTTLGYEEDIAAMPGMYDYSKAFFSRYYRPDNTILFIAGDVEPEAVLPVIREHYGEWRPGYVAPEVAEEPPQREERRVAATYAGQTLPILWVSYKVERLDPANPTRVAADLLADLAFGPTSDAYRRLVIEEQVVEFLDADVGANRDPGVFDIYTRVKDPEKVDYVLGIIDNTVAAYRESPPDPERLTALKSRVKYGFLMGLETPDAVASRVARHIAISGGLDELEALHAAYDEVTPQGVLAAARAYLAAERRTVGVLRSAADGAAAPAGNDSGPSARDALLGVEADPTVSFSITFDVGSQDDPPGKEGLAYLTGEMISDAATERNSYQQILEKLYPLASGYEARVDKETTTLTGRTHRDNLEQFLPLLTDAYLRPAFDPKDFERIRSDALNFIRNELRYSSDEELGKAALHELVFRGTRYAHPPEGTVAGLESITLEDVRRFYERHYTAARMRFGVGGGFDRQVVDALAASRAQLPQGDAGEAPGIAAPPIDGREVLLVDKPGADASISFGFPLSVSRGERDFYALAIANSWFGEHRNQASHLFQVIREARGLNYGNYSYIEAFPEGGERQMPPVNVPRRQQLFEVWIRTLPNEQAHFALRAAMRELERLVDRGMSAAEFELTRSFLKKYVLHFADTTARRLGYAVDDRFYGLTEEGHLERFSRILDELTVEDVNAAIRRHLQYRDLKIAIVTGEAAAVAEALAADAPSPIEYATPKPQSILEEDREIASHPLGIDAEDIEIVPVDRVFAD
ncbi:MAG: insulinase family protein [Gammaproteobacteria bacterium]|nr:insulinase family protein [Gammaproteobacteria bacterium]